MKILIVGGTGMIGGHAAVHLSAQGHEVVLASRRPAAGETPMAGFPTLVGDYTKGDFTTADLAPFDAIVFAAGNDIRHLPKGLDEREFWRVTQIEGVPAFVARARQAGVKRLVHLGSYYHQVLPHLADTNAYVHARMQADHGARALATADFNVSTLNPPSIVGVMTGIPARRYEVLAAWGRGELPDIPDFAPAGGTNYMSVRSLVEAIEGALRGAESGKAYLIGDQNLTFRAFFQMIVEAVGGTRSIEERNEEHPLLPDAFIVPGRGHVLSYEPEPGEVAMLGYRRNDVRRAVDEIVGSLEPARAGHQ
ncbi:NAD-dependent epimerase/dehydratase family protein [Bradyrhizobium sp. U87765 SZCCT0131]|uniref:NAD-dependent epimerase/dehydratase family protein n=1 Tax=unclassified Bradyrhizobium TaxID=2631580 RepID=UPI001BA9BE62|nr:NAD-dependent epimerase/dehydratase family protein [Bradyrhizobium sp. U87765 SZCCT0131]MBR1261058.1 NAD-dependent epimerase/dehydratase family protein [Bradyrhizobium sp. U87765 SZCCT0134]MBR1303494.1 NAD-dependent epimerase/dehydratase family protein [Bradyrhizobium sp. U87765 SZCCT0110]MBR1319100.1 NAD-dependent epimerase/dehydratase family protein [Bradyrhizobium sp. U87765 SZCCT0109]MBR1347425.1 NAD-dependent epimerase/dehydratase family protein [Bradyrhizobium sp. U87765 SZCCT0048]